MRFDVEIVRRAGEDDEPVASLTNVPAVPDFGEVLSVHYGGRSTFWSVVERRWDFYPPRPETAGVSEGHAVVYVWVIEAPVS